MSNLRSKVISDLELWCAITGTAPSTLGRAAVGSGNALARLKNGQEVTLGTVERLLDYVDRHPIGIP